MAHEVVKIITDQSKMVVPKGRDYATPLFVGVGDTTKTDLKQVKVANAAEAVTLFGADSILTKYITIAFQNGMNICYALDIHSLDNLEQGLQTTLNLPVRMLVPLGMVETEENTFISTTILAHIQAMEPYNRRVCVFSLGKGEVIGDTTNQPPATITAIKNHNMIAISSNFDDEIAPGIAQIKSRINPAQSVIMKHVTGYGLPQTDYSITQMDIADENRCNLVTTDTSTEDRVSTASFYTMGDPLTGRTDGDLEFVFMELEYRLRTQLGASDIIGTVGFTDAGMSQIIQRAKAQLMYLADNGTIQPIRPDDIIIPIQAILKKQEKDRTEIEQQTLAQAIASKTVEMEIKFRYYGVVKTIIINPLSAVI